MTREEALIYGAMNGTNIVLAAIIGHLDTAGIASKAQFADELERVAAEAERTQTAEQAEQHPRADTFMMRNLAKLLRDGRPTPWRPSVVDGGKED